MTHRIQVIGDELMGADGEAATLFSEMVLCEYPTRPVQFAISPLVRYPLASVLSRAPCDIFGKLAERIVLGLGLHELRLGADAEKVFAVYKRLCEEILSKTSSVLYLLTIPQEAFPEAATEVEKLNGKMETKSTFWILPPMWRILKRSSYYGESLRGASTIPTMLLRRWGIPFWDCSFLGGFLVSKRSCRYDFRQVFGEKCCFCPRLGRNEKKG